MVDEITKYLDDINLSSVVCEVNLDDSNLESGGWTHVPPSMSTRTKECSWNFEVVDYGESLSMQPLLRLREKESVILKMTSGK